MIDQITNNHYWYEGKLYFAPKKALESYNTRRTIRNLLSRSRLLDNTEASSVKPNLSRVCVWLVGGRLVAQATLSKDKNESVLRAVNDVVVFVLQTKKIGLITARNYAKECDLDNILADLPLHYIREDLVNELQSNKGS